MKILAIIIAVAMVFALIACENDVPAAPMVTRDCTDLATDSLTARAQVNRLEAGPLSLRGFVYMEGTTGNPEIAIIPLENPSFELGDLADVPAGWSISSTGPGVKSTEQVKVGSYSLKVTGRDSDGQQWTYQVLDDMSDLEGEYVTFGAWLWCDTPNRLRIGVRALQDRTILGTTFSSLHPGDAQWHWVTVTRRMDTGMDAIRVEIQMPSGTVVSGYADGAIVVKGRAVFEHGSFGTGAYSLPITGLNPDTTYRIRAFGQNQAGIWYGDAVNCKTLQEP